MGQTFMAEAQALVAEIQTHLTEARQWAETVNGDLVVSDRFRTEGLSRLNEFQRVLRVESAHRKQTSSIPNRQPG